MKETELASKFITFLSGSYDVYSEVPCSGIIDIVGVRSPIIISIECKMCLSFDVIEQAVKNTRYSHYAYVGVPAPKRHFGFSSRVCEQYGVGILTYSEKANWGVMKIKRNDERPIYIGEHVPARLNRNIVKPRLFEWMKKSVAGSQNDRMTAFKNTVEEIEAYLIKKGGKASIKQTFKDVIHHYSNFTSAKSSITSMCREGVIKNFTYDNGEFILTKITQ